VTTADNEYAKMMDVNTPLPTPPVYAARLSALMKNLATAQGAVEASIKARKDLLAGLGKLIDSNRAKLAEDEATAQDLSIRREGIEAKKKDVEDGIMRGLSTLDSAGVSDPALVGLGAQVNGGTNGHRGGPVQGSPETEGFTPPPPDVEEFTPPPQESTTETGDPAPLIGDVNEPNERLLANTTGAERLQEQPPKLDEPAPAFEPPPALSHETSDAMAAANSFLENLSATMPSHFSQAQTRQASSELPPDGSDGGAGDPRLKRRKLSHKSGGNIDEDIFGVGDVGGIDEEGVTAMLGTE
jgi:regulator of Ty1 transposition protein 103